MAVVFNQLITSAGGTFTYDPQTWGGGSAIISIYTNEAISLSNDFRVDLSGLPNEGATITITAQFEGNTVNLNGNHFYICNGQDVPQYLVDRPLINVTHNTGDYHGLISFFISDYFIGGGIPGELIIDHSINAVSLGELTDGKIIVGNASNVATSVTPTGDITISNTGVTAISAGVIVNADVNANAAIATTKLAAKTANKIARYDASGFLTDTGAFLVNADVDASAAIALSKLAALTASKVVVTNVSGVMTTANQVSPSLGGNGVDNSAASGFPVWAAGTQTVGAIADLIELQVSFETGYAGDFKIKMPYTGTISEIYAYATKAIAGTDSGTIVPKNNAGTTMTAGTVTFAASDVRGTAYTATPSANNTFVAGDVLTFTTAKATAGGVVQLSIKTTRTN